MRAHMRAVAVCTQVRVRSKSIIIFCRKVIEIEELAASRIDFMIFLKHTTSSTDHFPISFLSKKKKQNNNNSTIMVKGDACRSLPLHEQIDVSMHVGWLCVAIAAVAVKNSTYNETVNRYNVF